jgi:hypothetical protein
MTTFTESTGRFLAAATWLTEDDQPAVVTLMALAAELDVNLNPPLVAQYGLTYRNLLKRKPTIAEEVDELAKLLRR